MVWKQAGEALDGDTLTLVEHAKAMMEKTAPAREEGVGRAPMPCAGGLRGKSAQAIGIKGGSGKTPESVVTWAPSPPKRPVLYVVSAKCLDTGLPMRRPSAAVSRHLKLVVNNAHADTLRGAL